MTVVQFLAHLGCSPIHTCLGVRPIYYNGTYFSVDMHRLGLLVLLNSNYIQDNDPIYKYRRVKPTKLTFLELSSKQTRNVECTANPQFIWTAVTGQSTKVWFNIVTILRAQS